MYAVELFCNLYCIKFICIWRSLKVIEWHGIFFQHTYSCPYTLDSSGCNNEWWWELWAFMSGYFWIFQTVMQTNQPDNHLKSVGPLKLVLGKVHECLVCCFPGWPSAACLTASASFGGASPVTPLCTPGLEKENWVNVISPFSSGSLIQYALTLKFGIKDQP